MRIDSNGYVTRRTSGKVDRNWFFIKQRPDGPYFITINGVFIFIPDELAAEGNKIRLQVEVFT